MSLECSVCFEQSNNKTNCKHDLCKLCQKRCSICPICRNPDFKKRIPNYWFEHQPFPNYFLKNRLHNKYNPAPDAYTTRYTKHLTTVYNKQTILQYALKKNMGQLHYKVQCSYKGHINFYDGNVLLFNDIEFIYDVLEDYSSSNLFKCVDKLTLSLQSDVYKLFYKSYNFKENQKLDRFISDKIFSEPYI